MTTIEYLNNNGHYTRKINHLAAELKHLVPDGDIGIDAMRGLPKLIERAKQVPGAEEIASRARRILLNPDNPELWETANASLNAQIV